MLKAALTLALVILQSSAATAADIDGMAQETGGNKSYGVHLEDQGRGIGYKGPITKSSPIKGGNGGGTVALLPCDDPTVVFTADMDCAVPTPTFGNLNAPTPPTPDRATVDAFAIEYLKQIDLPRPTADISAKNGGICGVSHSLDLHMRPEVLFSEDGTAFGTVTMHIYGKVKVNWGDGATDTYTTGGGPWPTSDITHAWSVRGTYDVTATVVWTAVYTVGPYNGQTFTGQLGGLQTTDVLRDFRVWEAQAVLVDQGQRPDA